ncbi:MAG TPA: response regulator [Anaerolineaceae bacterium]
MAAVKKVMLIEDDQTMQSVLRTLLEIEGYQVSTAPDRLPLDQIVRAIRETKPDSILLDVHLHSASGFEILDRIRRDPTIAGTRVVMTSGMDMKDECIAAGASDFLLKPFMPDELIHKLGGV